MPEEKKEISTFVQENLAKGFIWPSHSPQTSVIFLIPKKDGGKQVVTDYRHVNLGTIQSNYPLPLISQLMDQLHESNMFLKMDVRWGYHNVHICEGDEWKVTFVMHNGAYKPLVMLFGICNSLPTFQHMMNDIFVGVIDRCLMIYIDDLLVFTKRLTREEHVIKVHMIL